MAEGQSSSFLLKTTTAAWRVGPNYGAQVSMELCTPSIKSDTMIKRIPSFLGQFDKGECAPDGNT